MKVGVLKCDTVREQFRPRFGDYPGMFEALLHSVDPGLEFVIYDVEHGELPSDTAACAAWLITGSRWGVYDPQPWIAPLEDYVRHLHAERRRLVGICFGHQLIAHALGGTAEKSHRGWGVGVATVQVRLRPAWMLPPLDEFSLIVSHQDQVTVLPPGAEVLAGSDFCPYAALSVGRHILTFQGHPEFDTEFSRALIEMRAETLGAEIARKGFDSLHLEIHASDVAHWIVRFLHGGQA